MRLDLYLTGEIEDASRSFVQKIIKDQRVRVNGQVCKRASRTVQPGDCVTGELPPPPSTHLEPEDIPLDILFQDDHVVVVNKPAGLVVHPAPGHHRGTLVNALLHHCPDLQETGAEPLRPGIVHRLDRDTSGVIVVAKTARAFSCLSRQAREHDFDRRYLALVRGEFPEDSGRIEAAIGRSMTDRAKMSVTGIGGRDAVTRFAVVERFGVASLLSVELETGRTHQIRVHLRFVGHPVLGDPVYGIAQFGDWPIPDAVRTPLNELRGQALHAERLGFVHPATGEHLVFSAPPPADFASVLASLRAWRSEASGP